MMVRTRGIIITIKVSDCHRQKIFQIASGTHCKFKKFFFSLSSSEMANKSGGGIQSRQRRPVVQEMESKGTQPPRLTNSPLTLQTKAWFPILSPTMTVNWPPIKTVRNESIRRRKRARQKEEREIGNIMFNIVTIALAEIFCLNIHFHHNFTLTLPWKRDLNLSECERERERERKRDGGIQQLESDNNMQLPYWNICVTSTYSSPV